MNHKTELYTSLYRVKTQSRTHTSTVCPLLSLPSHAWKVVISVLVFNQGRNEDRVSRFGLVYQCKDLLYNGPDSKEVE